MEKLAEIGEKVLYTGELHHACDPVTKDLMINHLIIGEWYEIQEICDYTGRLDWHYYLTKDFWAPCKSFVTNCRPYMERRYNLK